MYFLLKDPVLIGPFETREQAQNHLDLMKKYSGQTSASLSKFIITSPGKPYNYGDREKQ